VFLPSAFYRKPANHKNGILALRLLDGAWKAVLDEGLECGAPCAAGASGPVPLVFRPSRFRADEEGAPHLFVRQALNHLTTGLW